MGRLLREIVGQAARLPPLDVPYAQRVVLGAGAELEGVEEAEGLRHARELRVLEEGLGLRRSAADSRLGVLHGLHEDVEANVGHVVHLLLLDGDDGGDARRRHGAHRRHLQRLDGGERGEGNGGDAGWHI